jgi:hypothetical protein
MQKSVVGIVSRVSPVHTALRNCTRDEGRFFEVGNQVLISSHRKLPLSKAMVVVEPLHFLRTAAANGHDLSLLEERVGDRDRLIEQPAGIVA